jgi:hypothetical protein
MNKDTINHNKINNFVKFCIPLSNIWRIPRQRVVISSLSGEVNPSIDVTFSNIVFKNKQICTTFWSAESLRFSLNTINTCNRIVCLHNCCHQSLHSIQLIDEKFIISRCFMKWKQESVGVPKINWRIFSDCHKEIQQVNK